MSDNIYERHSASHTQPFSRCQLRDRRADRGWFDEAGHLHFTGRASTLIKTAGSNVSPAEVEAVLDAVPGVVHSFVVGIPHPVRGQVVAAAVVPAHGAKLTAAALMAHARQNLSSFKVPTVVLILSEDQLPMLPTGKIDRTALVAMLAESTSGRD